MDQVAPMRRDFSHRITRDGSRMAFCWNGRKVLSGVKDFLRLPTMCICVQSERLTFNLEEVFFRQRRLLLCGRFFRQLVHLVDSLLPEFCELLLQSGDGIESARRGFAFRLAVRFDLFRETVDQGLKAFGAGAACGDERLALFAPVVLLVPIPDRTRSDLEPVRYFVMGELALDIEGFRQLAFAALHPPPCPREALSSRRASVLLLMVVRRDSCKSKQRLLSSRLLSSSSSRIWRISSFDSRCAAS